MSVYEKHVPFLPHLFFFFLSLKLFWAGSILSHVRPMLNNQGTDGMFLQSMVIQILAATRLYTNIFEDRSHSTNPLLVTTATGLSLHFPCTTCRRAQGKAKQHCGERKQ